MALRNLFDGLASETTLKRLLANLHFARTTTDQLRVNVDSGSLNVNTIVWANNGGYTTWYSTGSPNSMDAREQQKIMARTAAQQVRTQRWVIT